ncbi:MAG: SGNH/GDSL hydrolase family protein [Planctomycetota bacterium]
MTFAAILGLVVALPSVLAQEPQRPSTTVAWRDGKELRAEGQGFPGSADAWVRLPAAAADTVPKPVWELAQDSAGIAVRFVTDSQSIRARWTLRRDRIALPHMAASGASGLDLYRREGERWRWLAATQPKAKQNSVELIRFADKASQPAEYLCYLPLYNGVESFEIGVDDGATLEPAAPRPATRKPIVFYGTSITQGASASRPGMCHVAILGRRLDRETINLGFSGNGRMELALADLLAGIDAAIYVVDCLPNMSPEQVGERAEPFVRRLRERRPGVPILLVEDRTFANAHALPKRADDHRRRRAALRAAYDRLRAAGFDRLDYLGGDRLLGDDDDATVDSSHPSDLGFFRQADAFEPVLTALLR